MTGELVTPSVRAAKPEGVTGLALEVEPKAAAPGVSDSRGAAWSFAKLRLAFLSRSRAASRLDAIRTGKLHTRASHSTSTDTREPACDEAA